MTLLPHAINREVNVNQVYDAVLRSRRCVGLMLFVALFFGGVVQKVDAAIGDQRVFSSPEAAAEAVAAAWRSRSKDDLLAIFGPAGEKLVSSGDPVAESHAWERLASAYDEAHRIESDGPAKAILVLGQEDWPYPIPIIKGDSDWRFDAGAGAEQIIDRRIGRNELNAIGVCHAYVEAQYDYISEDRSGNGIHEFAQRVLSSKGKHDGLYWPASSGAEESPLGPLVAAAEAQGYGRESAEGQAPFHGYFYKILTRQGQNAYGGVRDYMAGGHLKGGFALVAFPASYAQSGVMTFLVNQDGIVFEKNLGPDTAELARVMTEYNPDETWKPARP
jgi:hypothetical protein